MPAAMASPAKTVLACALLAAALFAGCSKLEQGTEDEPAREGLALDLAGIEYNVFITRELNPQIPPDNAYYKGPLAKKGEALYGVFLEACNNSTESLPTASSFKIIDNQGNEFEPTELPEDNDFAYHPTELGPDQCQPEAGTVAQLGRRPDRCCSSSCRSPTPTTGRSSSRSRRRPRLRIPNRSSSSSWISSR